jgi:hypothetical protein
MMGVSGDFRGPRRVFGPRRIDDPAPPGAYGDLAEMRQAFAREPAVAPAPETCPSPEMLWSAFHGELPPAEARQVVDHTVSCPACAEDWRLAREVEYRTQDMEREEAAQVWGGGARFGSWRKWTAGTVAAASLAASMGALQWAQYEGSQIAEEVTRAELRGEVQGSIHALVLKGTELPRGHCLLRWSPVPEAASYDVLVSTADSLQVVARVNGLKRPEYLIPESSLTALPPKTRIDWKVTAVSQDGLEVASSITFFHHIE